MDAEKAAAVPEQPKSPKEQEIDNIKKGIDEERLSRSKIIEEIKRQRRRIAYKLDEKQAVAKLVEMNKDTAKNIGYLKRKKEQIEFKITTEAYTLDIEKQLLRKKSEIDSELDEAYKSYRLKKKAEYIDGDIEALAKSIEELEKKIEESDKRLDELYSNLRRLSGAQKRREQERHGGKKQIEEPKKMEISLEDIAVIKKDKKGAAQQLQHDAESV